MDDETDQVALLRAMIDEGKIVIFSEREARTLMKIATFFDVEHDDKNLNSLKRIVHICQTLSALGVFGRLMAVMIFAALGAIAAIAQLSEKMPIIDRYMHWGSPE